MLGQEVGELLVGRFVEGGLLPQVGRQVGIGLGNRSISCLGEIAQSRGGTTGLGVAILDTGHVEQLLGNTSGDDSGTTRGGDQTYDGAATFAGNLARNSMGFTDLVTPITSSHGHDRELGEDDRSANGGGDLLGALNAQADVSVAVSDSDESLEPRALTGASLLLDGHDLQHLILQARAEEEIDDLTFLDGKGEKINLL